MLSEGVNRKLQSRMLKIDEEDRVKKEEKTLIAKNLKKLGVEMDLIVKATGLSSDEINRM
jgi:hypothetical protein